MAGAQIVITAKDQNVAAVLRGVTDQLQAASKKAKDGFDVAGLGSKAFEGTLKDLKSEMKSHDKLFGFYGGQLQNLAGLSKSAGAELAGLFIGLASGNVIVAAIEGVKMVASAVREHREEMREAAEQARQVAEVERQVWQDVADAMHPLTAGMKAYREEVAKADDATKSMQEKFLKMKEAGPGIVAWIKAAFGDESGLIEFNRRLDEAQRTIDRVLKTGREAGEAKKAVEDQNMHWTEGNRLRADAARLQGQATSEAERHRQKVEEIARDEKLSADERQRALQIEGAEHARQLAVLKERRDLAREETSYRLQSLGVSTEVAKLELERQHSLDQIRIKMAAADADTKRALAEELAGTRAVYDERIRIAQIHEQFATPPAEGTEDSGQNLARSLDELASEDKHKKFVDQLERDKKATKDFEQSAVHMGNTVGTALAGLATHSTSLSQALRQSLVAALGAIRDYAVKSITATAGPAAAKAADSQAGIPVLGPGLAAAAMAAMFSLVMGLVSSVGSAEGGTRTPSLGGPFPYLLHPNETVIPSDMTDRINAMTGQQPVSHSYTINVSAMDARSFRDFMKDNAKELIPALQKNAQDRRTY